MAAFLLATPVGPVAFPDQGRHTGSIGVDRTDARIAAIDDLAGVGRPARLMIAPTPSLSASHVDTGGSMEKSTTQYAVVSPPVPVDVASRSPVRAQSMELIHSF